MQEEIEMLLWDYIDDRCNETDRHYISQLLASDDVWRKKYDELIAFNNYLTANIELEQPSLRFTQNVINVIENSSLETLVRMVKYL